MKNSIVLLAKMSQHNEMIKLKDFAQNLMTRKSLQFAMSENTEHQVGGEGGGLMQKE
jgi:hypothetical protein